MCVQSQILRTVSLTDTVRETKFHKRLVVSHKPNVTISDYVSERPKITKTIRYRWTKTYSQQKHVILLHIRIQWNTSQDAQKCRARPWFQWLPAGLSVKYA